VASGSAMRNGRLRWKRAVSWPPRAVAGGHGGHCCGHADAEVNRGSGGCQGRDVIRRTSFRSMGPKRRWASRTSSAPHRIGAEDALWRSRLDNVAIGAWVGTGDSLSGLAEGLGVGFELSQASGATDWRGPAD